MYVVDFFSSLYFLLNMTILMNDRSAISRNQLHEKSVDFMFRVVLCEYIFRIDTMSSIHSLQGWRVNCFRLEERLDSAKGQWKFIGKS